MKVLMLWKYYPQYLSYFYKKYPYVGDLPFEEHRNKIFDDHFGWPADLSKYMNLQGIKTEFIIANAEVLQKKWAKENDFRYSPEGWEKEIVMEQIKHFRPVILWITSIFDYYGKFVKEALRYSKKAIAWVSCPTPKILDVSGFKILITSHPEMLKDQQHLFDDVIITKPGFDSEILKNIGFVEKKYDVTFGVSMAHSKRAKLLTYLIKNDVDIKVFGYLHEKRPLGKLNGYRRAVFDILKRRNFHKGMDVLKRTFKTDYQRNIEIIKSIHQGTIFGLDMYSTLAASRISLNVHIDVAGDNAGNMRMFEATGAGTCLLTEYSENINDLFEPGKEILTYKSKEELLEIIQKLLNDNEKIEQIAKAGQKRTLQYHTLERMFNDIKPAFNLYKQI